MKPSVSHENSQSLNVVHKKENITVRQIPARQRIRKALVLLVFLSFPVTMNYLSPYVIIDGAMNGIVNGSLVMFVLMFISSLALGRAWCGWVCPGAAMADMAEPINNRLVNGRKMDWIKWLIWLPWISLIVWLAIRSGGYQRVDFFHLTNSGVSMDSPEKFLIYYIVIALFVGLAMIFGRRAGCHTICWMAPFMILGRWVRNRFGWPSLRLVADASACTDCNLCNKNCPMSLDVSTMVQTEKMEDAECILCGNCVDGCAKKAIRYSFSAGK
ncbi:MAG: 4Fe-4S binding protein [Chloroflexi bacterium]|nr:4Fe-4S binding protein [Chloroflexota bacterium]